MNQNCKNDPNHSLWQIYIGCDGDSACDVVCKKEYEEQRNHFFEDIVDSAENTEAWIRGKID